MSPQQAARIVFLAGAVEATYVLIRHRQGAEGTFKSLWAVGVLTLGLAVFADFVPQVAGPFAILVLIAMAVRNSGELGGVIRGAGAGGGTVAVRARTAPPTSTAGSQGGTSGNRNRAY